MLFFVGPIQWGRPVRLPESEPGAAAGWPHCGEAGLVAGRLMNLPVYAGLTIAYPVDWNRSAAAELPARGRDVPARRERAKSSAAGSAGSA